MQLQTVRRSVLGMGRPSVLKQGLEHVQAICTTHAHNSPQPASRGTRDGHNRIFALPMHVNLVVLDENGPLSILPCG